MQNTTETLRYDFTALNEFFSNEVDPLELCEYLDDCQLLLMQAQTENPAAYRLDICHAKRRLTHILRRLTPVIDNEQSEIKLIA